MKIEKTSDVIAKQFYTQVKKELKKQFPNDKFSNIENIYGSGQLEYRTENLISNKWKTICNIKLKGAYDYFGKIVDKTTVHSYERKYADVVKRIAEKFKVDMLFEDFNGYEDSKDIDWFFPKLIVICTIIILFLLLMVYSVPHP